MNLVDCTNKREHPTKSSISYSLQVDCILCIVVSSCWFCGGSLILFLYFKHFQNQKNQWFWVFKKIKTTGSFKWKKERTNKEFKVGSLTQFFDTLKHCSSMYCNFFRKLVMGWVPELILFDFENCWSGVYIYIPYPYPPVPGSLHWLLHPQFCNGNIQFNCFRVCENN
jgi:hypothetical protein